MERGRPSERRRAAVSLRGTAAAATRLAGAAAPRGHSPPPRPRPSRRPLSRRHPFRPATPPRAGSWPLLLRMRSHASPADAPRFAANPRGSAAQPCAALRARKEGRWLACCSSNRAQPIVVWTLEAPAGERHGLRPTWVSLGLLGGFSASVEAILSRPGAIRPSSPPARCGHLRLQGRAAARGGKHAVPTAAGAAFRILPRTNSGNCFRAACCKDRLQQPQRVMTSGGRTASVACC